MTRAAAFAIALITGSTVAQAGSAPSIRSGTAATFRLVEVAGRWRPIVIRRGRIGPPDTRPGEITLGLTPPGSIGIVKLHLFERTVRVVDVDVIAMAGARALSEAKVCGHRDLDSWVVLPRATSRVIVRRIMSSMGRCDGGKHSKRVRPRTR